MRATVNKAPRALRTFNNDFTFTYPMDFFADVAEFTEEERNNLWALCEAIKIAEDMVGLAILMRDNPRPDYAHDQAWRHVMANVGKTIFRLTGRRVPLETILWIV